MGPLGDWCVLSGVLAALATQAGVRVSVSPTTATGSQTGGGPGNIVTNNSVSVTVNVPGTHSYAWVKVSGDPGIEATAPTSPTTFFRAFVGAGSEVASGLFRCDVTVNGLVYPTGTVFVQLVRDL